MGIVYIRAACYLCHMFIREVKKKNGPGGKIFSQFSLVQASRINGVVKQRNILYLGSDQVLCDPLHRKLICLFLQAKIFKQESLFALDIPKDLEDLAQNYYAKYLVTYGDQPITEPVSIPPSPQKADYQTVDINQLEHLNVKSFGAEHLCTQVLEKLDLTQCLNQLNWSEDNINLAKIAICAKAIFASSEFKTSQYLKDNSELGNLLLGDHQPISHKLLYKIADMLYAQKQHIDKFLYSKITSLFDIEDKIIIFDISNTYFETAKHGSEIANYGRSKEKRSDCKIVVFTGVINAQGFIKHSRIYEGNTPDPATLEDMINDLEHNSQGMPKKTIVIDAGIATEDNINFIRSKNYTYVCVARSGLKTYELDEANIKKVRLAKKDKEEYVDLCIVQQQAHQDTWMYIKSPGKMVKEKSMNAKLSARFLEELQTLNDGLSVKRKIKNIDKVHQKIGRIKQAHKRVSSQYKIEVKSQGTFATAITWEYIAPATKLDKMEGIYFIRTNLAHHTESDLWGIYNCIREVESTFRCLKSDLNIRPIHHQNDHRIESHIYLTILAYQLINTIRHMLKQNGIKLSWSNVLRLMQTQIILTTEIITASKKMHLRKPNKPNQAVANIYDACGCTHTIKSKKTYVVYH